MDDDEGSANAEAAAEVAPSKGPVPPAAVLDRFDLLRPIVLMPLGSESARARDVDVFLRLLVLISLAVIFLGGTELLPHCVPPMKGGYTDTVKCRDGCGSSSFANRTAA